MVNLETQGKKKKVKKNLARDTCTSTYVLQEFTAMVKSEKRRMSSSRT